MELSFDFILLQVLRKRRRRQIDLQVFLSRVELELPLVVISSWITTSPSKNCFHSPLKFIIDPFNGERAAMKSRFTKTAGDVFAFAEILYLDSGVTFKTFSTGWSAGNFCEAYPRSATE